MIGFFYKGYLNFKYSTSGFGTVSEVWHRLLARNHVEYDFFTMLLQNRYTYFVCSLPSILEAQVMHFLMVNIMGFTNTIKRQTKIAPRHQKMQNLQAFNTTSMCSSI